MINLVWLPDAKDDLERLHTFIKTYNTDAANSAIQTLIKSAQTLQDFPEKGQPWQPDLNFRQLPVRFGAKGYIIRYRLHENNIVIVRVWHGLEDR